MSRLQAGKGLVSDFESLKPGRSQAISSPDWLRVVGYKPEVWETVSNCAFPEHQLRQREYCRPICLSFCRVRELRQPRSMHEMRLLRQSWLGCVDGLDFRAPVNACNGDVDGGSCSSCWSVLGVLCSTAAFVIVIGLPVSFDGPSSRGIEACA